MPAAVADAIILLGFSAIFRGYPCSHMSGGRSKIPSGCVRVAMTAQASQKEMAQLEFEIGLDLLKCCLPS